MVVQYSLRELLQFSDDLAGYEKKLKSINEEIKDIRNMIARSAADEDSLESWALVIRNLDKSIDQLDRCGHSVDKLSQLSETIGGMYMSCENYICELADGENMHRAAVNASLVDLAHFHTFVTQWNLKI